MIEDHRQEFLASLFEVIQTLCTHSLELPMNIDCLNKNVFRPYRSKNGNKMKSGILQLPPSLTMIIDETALTPGEVHENGIKNLKSLKEIINWQTVEYDQIVYSHKINSNVNILVVSEGKSLLNVPCRVPILVSLNEFYTIATIKKFFLLLL